jgi:hypothetical protein
MRRTATGGSTRRGLFLPLLWFVAMSWAFSICPSMAQTATDFSGTVLMVNVAEGEGDG